MCYFEPSLFSIKLLVECIDLVARSLGDPWLLFRGCNEPLKRNAVALACEADEASFNNFLTVTFLESSSGLVSLSRMRGPSSSRTTVLLSSKLLNSFD